MNFLLRARMSRQTRDFPRSSGLKVFTQMIFLQGVVCSSVIPFSPMMSHPTKKNIRSSKTNDFRLLIVDLRSKKKGHHPGSLIGSLRRFDTRNEDRDELIAFFYDVCHFSRLTQRFAFDDFQRKSINLSSSSAGVSILSFSFTNQQSTIDNHQSNVAASLISAL